MRQIHTFIITAEARKKLDKAEGEGVFMCEVFDGNNFPGFVRATPKEMIFDSDGAIYAKYEIETK